MQKIKWILIASLAFLFSGCSGNIQTVSQPPNTSNKTALAIYEKLSAYARAARQSWPIISAHVPLKIGDHSRVLPEIRDRLIALGDLSSSEKSSSLLFDSTLSRAVAQFQWRHGLESNGVVNQKTLNELNVNPVTRYRELARSMDAWAQLPENESAHYIHVNVPSFQLRLVERGNAVMEMRVITGRSTRPTPTLYSKVSTIVFNPGWTVPETILAKDVIPGMQKNPNYLKEHYDMRVYANWDKNAAEIDPLTIDWHNANAKNFTYRVSAPPGEKNPLGHVKFIFENEHDVYMHDTPDKALFSKIERAYSSGCIRLEKPFELVEYFYSDNTDLNAELVNQYLGSGETKFIQLKKPMPIHITYITAWVDQNGYVHFREDIYQQSLTKSVDASADIA